MQMLRALVDGLRDQVQGRTGGRGGDLFKSFAAVEDRSVGSRRSQYALNAGLQRELARLWTENTSDEALVSLMARLDHPAAQRRALELAMASAVDPGLRENMLQMLGQIALPEHCSHMLALLRRSEPPSVQLAALSVLQQFDRRDIAPLLLDLYPRAAAAVRAKICDVLLSRRDWALALLQAVDAGRFAEKDIAIEQLRQVALHHDKRLDDLVRKHWGNVASGTPEEKLAEMRRLSNDLRAGTGNAEAGKQLFARHCATCHRLFGEGNIVGPDLTHANRQDRAFLLASIVDPSAVIRKEYLTFVAHTHDGRVLTGLIAEQSASNITLLDAKNQRTTLPRSSIESLEESSVSLMPENLLKDLKPKEVRDLFGYLQSAAPPTVTK
jgi:putative heme-binding domain-containing protein